MMKESFYSKVISIAGADPHGFPPFYGNWSDFFIKDIFNKKNST